MLSVPWIDTLNLLVCWIPSLSLSTQPEICASECQLERAYFAEYWDGGAYSAVCGGIRALTKEDCSCTTAALISLAFSGVIARSPARTEI